MDGVSASKLAGACIVTGALRAGSLPGVVRTAGSGGVDALLAAPTEGTSRDDVGVARPARATGGSERALRRR
ncbi:MAG: hypothetical protein NZ898_15670, partial [Myxococcota bacterium]|nr:hypothetical protein [Myxococcota bacterium]